MRTKESPHREVATSSESPVPAHVLKLIELVFRASTKPAVWQEFATRLSVELDDAAITLTLELPALPTRLLAYRAHTLPEYTSVFADFASRGELPWRLEDVSTEAFHNIGETEPELDLPTTAFYREYMEPQGLEPEPPLGHIFAKVDGHPLAGIAIYRRVGKRQFAPGDLEWLDLLTPYLAQAYRVHATLLGHVNRRDAYQEVIDRFPTGVVLLDAKGSVVVVNRAARRIADLTDGFSLKDDRVRAAITVSDRALQTAVREVLDVKTDAGLGYDEGFTLARPSGKLDLVVMVSSVLAASEVGSLENVAAVVYIADPEFRQLGMRAMLRSFHQLTNAEIELAAMICEGETLESAAHARGVTLHTARSQLKQIFQKTGTGRQAELVSLVSSGLTNLQHRRRAGVSDESDEEP